MSLLISMSPAKNGGEMVHFTVSFGYFGFFEGEREKKKEQKWGT
jgi:hypothetical protein